MKNDDYATHYSLNQNYPNPFNPSTIIKYTIPSEVKSQKSKVKSQKENKFIPSAVPAGRQESKVKSVGTEYFPYVRLIVYDILGREVATLVNEKQKPGNYEVEFDGSKLTSGVYFYRLQTRNYTSTKKMILLR
jgi:hypothetical protein